MRPGEAPPHSRSTASAARRRRWKRSKGRRRDLDTGEEGVGPAGGRGWFDRRSPMVSGSRWPARVPRLERIAPAHPRGSLQRSSADLGTPRPQALRAPPVRCGGWRHPAPCSLHGHGRGPAPPPPTLDLEQKDQRAGTSSAPAAAGFGSEGMRPGGHLARAHPSRSFFSQAGRPSLRAPACPGPTRSGPRPVRRSGCADRGSG